MSSFESADSTSENLHLLRARRIIETSIELSGNKPADGEYIEIAAQGLAMLFELEGEHIDQCTEIMLGLRTRNLNNSRDN